MATPNYKNKVGRPLKFKSVEELETAIGAYFDFCDIQKEPYTMSGLAYYLDMDRRSLLNYSRDDKFFLTVKKARDRVEWSVEKLMLKSSGVVAGVIFNAKNNFGWEDKKQVEVDDRRPDESIPLLRKIANDVAVKGPEHDAETDTEPTGEN